MKKDLFMELAVEEIPSGMAPQIADGLKSGFERRLKELAVGFGKVVCFHTPRRFALLVSGVAPRAGDVTVESFGPSEAAAFGADGPGGFNQLHYGKPRWYGGSVRYSWQ